MTRIILLVTLIFYLLTDLKAGYVVSDNCKSAWMLLMDLKIEEAKSLLAEEIKKNPENYYAYYLDQTCDAYKLVINSNKADYEKFIDNFNTKRELMNDKDVDSPYYLSCYSEMEIQVGMFNIIHGDQFSGVRKMYTAYKKVYRNLDKYPDFKPSIKLDGFFNVSIATLPPFINWVVSFFGVSVDTDYGFKLLYENYNSQKNVTGINAESALFVILAAKINKTPELVYDFIRSLDTNISNTFVLQYFKANIAYRTGKNEEALADMKQIKNDQNAYTDILYSYMMGKILLRKLDPQAGYYLKRYLQLLEKKEYVKEMNYNLAIFYLLNGQAEKYGSYCEIVKTQGMDMQERDREALYDANLDYPPDVNLIKARLSLDGGYMDEYLNAIQDYEANPDNSIGHQLEFVFLSARYEARIGNSVKALQLFNEVIETGESEDYYFASEAALRAGYIYKEQGNFSTANQYFKKSVKLCRNDYYEYIEDKARKAMVPE